MDEVTFIEYILATSALVGGGAWIGKYLESRNSGKTTVELARIEEGRKLIGEYEEALKEIKELNEQLTREVTELNLHLAKSQSTFKMLAPVLKQYFKDRPEFIKLIEQAEDYIMTPEDK